MEDNFELDLAKALEEVVMSLDGRILNDELIAETTERMNIVAEQVYRKHNVPNRKNFTEQFVSYIITVSIMAGALAVKHAPYRHFEDYEPSDPTAHDPRLLQDAEEELPQPSFSEDDMDEVYTYRKPKTGDTEQPIHLGDFPLSRKPVPEGSNHANGMEADFAKNLIGNFDGRAWAVSFKNLMNRRYDEAKDLDVLTGWFANAIMTGYDKAKQEEHPFQEMSDKEMVHVEFYSHAGPGHPRQVHATLKFPTLDAAKTFIKFNAYGNTMPGEYYEIYEFVPSTTYKRRTIE